MSDYDPWAHAAQLHIPVVEAPIVGAKGLWYPHPGMIVIRPGMREFIARSVLAHELAHATLGHPGGHHPRNEAAANRLAARWLLTPEQVVDAARSRGISDRTCHDLCVTRTILITAIADLTGRTLADVAATCQPQEAVA